MHNLCCCFEGFKAGFKSNDDEWAVGEDIYNRRGCALFKLKMFCLRYGQSPYVLHNQHNLFIYSFLTWGGGEDGKKEPPTAGPNSTVDRVRVLLLIPDILGLIIVPEIGYGH